jgi:hypothetical protein
VVFKDVYECTQRMIDRGFQICGSVDSVKRQLADVLSCHGLGGEVDWLHWCFFYQGTVSRDVWRRQLDLFCEKVWPEFQ